jgi:hypothetical protein
MGMFSTLKISYSKTNISERKISFGIGNFTSEYVNCFNIFLKNVEK